MTLYALVLGPQGVLKMRTLTMQRSALQQTIDLMQHDIKKLEDSVAQWHRYSFYKEKIAREQLQMAKADDAIFFIKSH
jgi:cell division protein FtsB